MISFTRLGSFGRLANQIFQYAAVKGVSTKCGYEARIPRPEGLDLFQVFDLPEADLSVEDAEGVTHIYSEPRFSFSEEVFAVPDNTSLQGYFQSQRYFEHCAPELRRSLRFRDEILTRADGAAKLLQGSRGHSALVSLHVRRDDYLNLPDYHPVCTKDYYDSALSLLERSVGPLRVVVFSDDIAWCRQTFPGPRFRFSAHRDKGTDLCLMSRCSHHIIANSSYSWWGAWLNPSPDKMVVAPKVWFGPDGPQDIDDLLPADWIRL